MLNSWHADLPSPNTFEAIPPLATAELRLYQATSQYFTLKVGESSGR